jgi:hypothetical protein
MWLSGHSRLWPLSGWIEPSCEPVAEAGGDASRHHSDGRTYRDEIARVVESGGHLFRMTPFWPDAWKLGRRMPWKPVSPGRFDLTQWDETYFEAFGDFLGRCAEQDIVVQLEMWDKPGMGGWHESRWPSHPFNPDHNVNYDQSVLPGGDGGNDIAFGDKLFYTTVRGERPELLRLQRAYFDRLLEAAEAYPNIIYCIENESNGGLPWQSHWAGLVRRRIPDALITPMPHNVNDHGYRLYFDDPNFNCLDGGGTALRYAMLADLSRHARMPIGGQHWPYDRIALVREIMQKYHLLMELRPQAARPVYVSNAFGLLIDSLWSMFCCGGAGLRYHRRTCDEAGTAYRWVRAFNDFLSDTGLDFVGMAPANHLLESPGHALCLAGPTDAVVYLPTPGEVQLTVPAGARRVRVRLFDCDSGTWLSDATAETLPAAGASEGRYAVLTVETGKATAAYVEFGQVPASEATSLRGPTDG